MDNFVRGPYDMSMSEEATQQVLGVESFRYRVEISSVFSPTFNEREKRLLIMRAEEEVKHGLLKGLQQFVIVKSPLPDTNELEASIYMPYVYDHVMSQKEDSINLLNNEVDRLNSEVSDLEAYVALPWYKKVFARRSE